LSKIYQIGWLGLVLASKLYFDFSNPDQFEQKMEALIRELRDRGRNTFHRSPNFQATKSISAANSTSAASTGSSATTATIVSSGLNAVRPISSQEVKEWLEQLGMGGLFPTFSEHKMTESVALAELLDIWRNDVRLAHDMLKLDLGVTKLGERLKFFRKLHNPKLSWP